MAPRTALFQFFIVCLGAANVLAFAPQHNVAMLTRQHTNYELTRSTFLHMASSDNEDGSVSQVMELVDDEEEAPKAAAAAAPFLSQGEILEESMSFSNDPKQTRVIGYIVVSLLPVLFLIPLMLGSRDLIPLDALPPVDM
mmetsp:Transcript_22218/g.33351  ORF Transcript_22218/g.33351 Transcript_22218/m.33351 type:complete len:140 (-) Transcript_22218:215-634(-)